MYIKSYIQLDGRQETELDTLTPHPSKHFTNDGRYHSNIMEYIAFFIVGGIVCAIYPIINGHPG